MSSVRGLFREFLETSTIHGLQHIGGESQKLGKLIWVVIVVCGFSIAALLIWDSVKGWEESPVSTSVETFPISEVVISFFKNLRKEKFHKRDEGGLSGSHHLSTRGLKYSSKL